MAVTTHLYGDDTHPVKVHADSRDGRCQLTVEQGNHHVTLSLTADQMAEVWVAARASMLAAREEVAA